MQLFVMGRNDVGKTNILRAILAFGSRQISKEDKCKHADPTSANPRITAHFDSFTEEDLSTLATLPIPISPKSVLTIAVEGNQPNQCNILVDEKPIQSSPGDSIDKAESSQTIESAQAPIATSELLKNTIPLLWKILPSIVLFNDPEPFASKVTMEELEGNTQKFETARRLLRLAGVKSFRELTPEDLAEGRDFRKEISSNLTQLLQKHWLQDKNLMLDIDYQSPHLLFTFQEETARSTYPEQHSEATLGYIAVLANLLDQLGKAALPESIILLFEEPGKQLHPGGQRDLQSLLQTLSKKHQIIYTSHSPFLIDKNFPGQIRLITKTKTGTAVNNKPHTYRVQEQESYFLLPYEPIRTALGAGYGDPLMFDNQNVILEGISDQILIGALSQRLSSVGDSRYLDLNTTALVPAGSAQNIETIAKMAKARQRTIAILFDSDECGRNEADRLKKKAKEKSDDPTTIMEREVLEINDVFSDKSPRCIEDLFPPKMYFDAVNKFYSSIFPSAWKSISSKSPYFKNIDKPIAVMIDKYFKDELKGDFGGFDKVRTAREMATMLYEVDVTKSDGQIRQEYEPVVNLIDSLKRILSGSDAERMPELKEEKPHSTTKPSE